MVVSLSVSLDSGCAACLEESKFPVNSPNKRAAREENDVRGGKMSVDFVRRPAVPVKSDLSRTALIETLPLPFLALSSDHFSPAAAATPCASHL